MESTFVKDHRLTDIEANPWFQLFSRIRLEHTKLLSQMIDARAMQAAIAEWGKFNGANALGDIVKAVATGGTLDQIEER
eukprot:4653596-Amphidinium_carterae.1